MLRKAAKMNLDAMEEQCMRFIEESGARLDMQNTGVHYILSSGYHSEYFFNMARAFENYSIRNYLAQFFLRKIIANNIDPRAIDILIGPATGALPLLYSLQNFPDFQHAKVMYVEKEKKVISGVQSSDIDDILKEAGGDRADAFDILEYRAKNMFASREEVKFVLGKNFIIQENDRIFVIDDVGTTFSSIRKTIDAVKEYSVQGVGVFIDRSPNGKRHITEQALGMQFVCGIRVPLVYFEDDCLHCKAGVKLVKV